MGVLHGNVHRGMTIINAVDRARVKDAKEKADDAIRRASA
ncbi:hypothetical protein ALP26_103234 [Pseudomonas savastanoi pv. glycinea]|uniref:Uncharacterized protein n=1 Tax=Pseudomonas savastanoi pv. glycinea TaxID=318 RepID=A0A0P9SGU7_PSESG|nr:Unknown protein sequence [Pseudomonas savastanoi pv. glycinea]KPC31145.1 Unknown protein sequence [Pseudomonas savastanoi pv. glycinea]KPC42087.1 Unknown protein sequence [Pseudomonas savastanoi pv. glycinea]KPC50606.1 Unknown protein sequence [Pseudomonas savastanoi pv. glycinea]KPX50705.1 hypothetical protein ALO37_102480 [Pseudomonas savastanoi pv. glycinea]